MVLKPERQDKEEIPSSLLDEWQIWKYQGLDRFRDSQTRASRTEVALVGVNVELKSEVTSQCLHHSHQTTPSLYLPSKCSPMTNPFWSTTPMFCTIRVLANHSAADPSVHFERKMEDQCSGLLIK